MKQIILVFGILIAMQTQAGSQKPMTPVKTVDSIDLHQYLGGDYWIFSRKPDMTHEQIIESNQALVTQGFDTCKLISTIQSSGLQQKIPLCQLVSGQ